MSYAPLYAYAQTRATQIRGVPAFDRVSDLWTTAGADFAAHKPDPLIALLRQDLKAHEDAAEPPEHARREICSGPQHARSMEAEKARLVRSLLWTIAEAYSAERVWGDELVQRQVERAMHADDPSQALRDLAEGMR